MLSLQRNKFSSAPTWSNSISCTYAGWPQMFFTVLTLYYSKHVSNAAEILNCKQPRCLNKVPGCNLLCILRMLLFWVITQWVAVISYQHFGTTYRSQHPWRQDRLSGCPEMLVRNYHYSLRNKPEGCRSHLLQGGSLKSRILCILAAR